MATKTLYPPQKVSCENNSLDLKLYIFEMSRMPFNEREKPDKNFMVRMHKHLRACNACSREYLRLKGEYASEEKWADHLKPANFAQIRENEETLNGLVSATN